MLPHLSWYRDRRAWRLLALRFLPWFAGLSLAWEIAQLPLYTLWTEATPGYIAFSVAHCTLGSWAYAASMPRIRLGAIEIGLSPFLQWLVVPPLALYFTRGGSPESVS